jgi:hypothetical protein
LWRGTNLHKVVRVHEHPFARYAIPIRVVRLRVLVFGVLGGEKPITPIALKFGFWLVFNKMGGTVVDVLLVASEVAEIAITGVTVRHPEGAWLLEARSGETKNGGRLVSPKKQKRRVGRERGELSQK